MPMDRSRNRRTAWMLLGVVGCMVALVAVSVPLYRLFCVATGYNGTTRRAESAPAERLTDKVITVRFNAEVGPDLDWDFHPKLLSVEVHPGEPQTITYEAVNHSDVGVTGTATYNVTPDKIGAYFDKIQCFCFTKQHLAPGQHAELPVTFFVDPEIVRDPETRDVDTITLSYTMFRAETPAPAAAVARPQGPQLAVAPR
jgi:cytochrome c oxidase assembly protein subunit 11